MRKRSLCYRPVYLRLSVMLVNCIHTAEDIVILAYLFCPVAPSF